MTSTATTAEQHEQAPMRGYATLLTTFSVGIGTAAFALGSRFLRPKASDLVLAGFAAHEITRILTRDRVAAPIRAPFEDAQREKGVSRGEQVKRALGDLVSCPYCTAPWVATALLAGFALVPGPARFVASTFTVVAISDGLQHLRTFVKQLNDLVEERRTRALH